MINEDGFQVPTNPEGDKTPQENDTPDWETRLKTTEAQKDHWRNKAIDPETGKPYKELYEESKKPTPKQESKETKTDNSDLLERIDKLALKTANISDDDEIELAKNFQKRTGMSIEEVVSDDIFQAKLDKLRDEKAVAAATSGVEGGGGVSTAKNTPEYWLAKGAPPTRDEVPDRATRVKIAKAFMAQEKKTGKFYND